MHRRASHAIFLHRRMFGTPNRRCATSQRVAGPYVMYPMPLDFIIYISYDNLTQVTKQCLGYMFCMSEWSTCISIVLIILAVLIRKKTCISNVLMKYNTTCIEHHYATSIWYFYHPQTLSRSGQNKCKNHYAILNV